MQSPEMNIIPPEEFPGSLLEIPKPPEKLYISGTLPPVDTKFITVIGSRRCTEYGQRALERIIGGLQGYNFTIVSGMAFGIDAFAHKFAMRSKLRTMAIPGSGLGPKVLYPANHQNLAKQIVAAGGCLISEFEPATEAARWTFVQRNRIMAGIGDITLVVEATNKSGTRITAKLATEYNRDVFAVPGSIFSSVSEGANQLLKEGAIPVTCAADILAHFGITTNKDTHAEQMDDCTPAERQLLRHLGSPIARGDLIRQCGIPAHKVNVLISAMEIKGLVVESMGKIQRV